MTQAELNRQVARATGESIDTIAHMGFVILTSGPFEREPLTVDWDQLDADQAVCPSSARHCARQQEFFN